MKSINKTDGKPWRERRLWFFPCSNGCGRNASSRTKRRAKVGICAVCERYKVHENQTSMFEGKPFVPTPEQIERVKADMDAAGRKLADQDAFDILNAGANVVYANSPAV